MIIYTITSLLMTSVVLIFVIERKYNFRNVVQERFFNVKNKKVRQTYFNFSVLSIIIALIFLIMYSNMDPILARVLIGILFSLNLYGSILFNPSNDFDDFYKKK